jgi:hypothetical protein
MSGSTFGSIDTPERIEKPGFTYVDWGGVEAR